MADVEAKRDGRYVELIGFYNPLTDPVTYKIEEERALYWLSVGAQPSDAVRRLLEKQGTYDRLARLHAGETLQALVAEYEGVPLMETGAAPAPAAEAVAGTVAVAEAVMVAEMPLDEEE